MTSITTSPIVIFKSMVTKDYIFILFVIFSASVKSQNSFGIFDAETKQPISYCTISFKNYNDGRFATKYGNFNLPTYLKTNDTIQISHLGYKTSILVKEKLRDSIYLIPKYQQLEEVVIRNSKPIKLNYGYKKGGNLSRALDKNHELGILILPEEDCNNCLVNNIAIPIKKYTIKEIDGKLKKINPNFSTIMKLLVYSIEDGLPKDVILTKPIFIEVNQDSPDELKVDLSNENVAFTQNGIFISFSKIESLNEEYNYLPLIQFTKRKSKTVNTASFFRAIFEDKKWKSINQGENKNYNLALKLEILEYK